MLVSRRATDLVGSRNSLIAMVAVDLKSALAPFQLVDDVCRPPLGLEENQADVFADDSQREELDRTHEEDDDHRRRPAPRGGMVADSVDQHPGRDDNRESGRGQAQVSYQP